MFSPFDTNISYGIISRQKPTKNSKGQAVN